MRKKLPLLKYDRNPELGDFFINVLYDFEGTRRDDVILIGTRNLSKYQGMRTANIKSKLIHYAPFIGLYCGYRIPTEENIDIFLEYIDKQTINEKYGINLQRF